MQKALIIEDNEDNMELITFILNEHGYETMKAETGMQGINLALQERPDFIILDIQLPDLDGYEVLKKIRASEIDGNIPIIAMTSYAMTGDREKMLSAGCDGYIEKPINSRKVMDQIKQILKGKK